VTLLALSLALALASDAEPLRDEPLPPPPGRTVETSDLPASPEPDFSLPPYELPRRPGLTSHIAPAAAVWSRADAAREPCPPGRNAGPAREPFFPPGTFEAWKCHGWSNTLSDALEAPLETDEGDRVLRFVWHRSFHDAMVIRAELPQAGDARIVSTRLPRGSHDAPERIETALDGEDAARLRAGIEDTWVCHIRQEGRIGFDGALWMIEGTDGVDYCAVETWSPRPDTPLGALGRLLVELTGRDIPEQDVY
jgi:hypothetical protein